MLRVDVAGSSGSHLLKTIDSARVGILLQLLLHLQTNLVSCQLARRWLCHKLLTLGVARRSLHLSVVLIPLFAVLVGFGCIPNIQRARLLVHHATNNLVLSLLRTTAHREKLTAIAQIAIVVLAARSPRIVLHFVGAES